jgi:hypothetical protein
MAESCLLPAAAYTALYELLADKAYRRMVDPRLELLGEELDVLDELRELYAARHSWAVANGEFALDGLLDDQHAQFASWLLALGTGDSTSFSEALTSKSNSLVAGSDVNRPIVQGWVLGCVHPRSFDRALPIVFCDDVGDRDVRLAYQGLVEHLAARPMDEAQWSEMDFTSIIIRCAGLTEGVLPVQDDGQSSTLGNAMSGMLRKCQYEMPDFIRRRLEGQIQLFVYRRNAIAHVSPSQGRSFSTEVPEVLRLEEIRGYLESITYFMAHLIREPLRADDTDLGRSSMLEGIRSELEWCLD